MEACGSSRYWARKLSKYWHTVKLMSPQFVKPYVKTNNMTWLMLKRFVPIKNVDQQAILSVHRARQGWVKVRTAQANQIRDLLSEFGIVIPQGIHSITKQMPDILENVENDLPGIMHHLLRRLNDHLMQLNRQVEELELQIKLWHKDNEVSQKPETIPGIGPMTAIAIVATVGDAREFKNHRQLAAWFGLVPKQYSSGGKQLLLGISKRGDTYLRTLLIHGARAVVRFAESKAGLENWLYKLVMRRNKNIAAVALANKNARIIWALLAKDRTFRPDHASIACATDA